MQYCHTGPLGRNKCATFSTKLTENLVQWATMHKCGMGQEEEKTPSILIMNLIPLGNLSSTSKGAFSQEGINK